MDELIIELKEDMHMHDHVMNLVRIMEESMAKIIPGIRIKAEPAVMYRWSKEAKDIYDEEGKIQVWKESA